MIQKPKLEPGQRVRVYGPVFCPKTWDVITSDEPRVGPITKPGEPGDGGVYFKDEARGDEFWVYSQQVRKLRPKQKPEKGRVDFTIHFDSHGYQTTAVTTRIDKDRADTSMRLLEVKPDEAVVSRSTLAKAWAVMRDGKPRASSETRCFNKFCEALGLAEDKA